MHSDNDNKICNDIMHNDITSINLICMYAVIGYGPLLWPAHSGGGSVGTTAALQWGPLTAVLQCAAWGQRGVRGDCGLQQSAALQLQPSSATTVS